VQDLIADRQANWRSRLSRQDHDRQRFALASAGSYSKSRRFWDKRARLLQTSRQLLHRSVN
jgi:hypothetical protein